MATQGAAGKIKNPLKGLRVVGKTRPIGEMAYVSLKGAIVQGDLHPGQRLVESALSARMGISRIPVREAIKKLEQDGLIEKLEKGGFIVKIPSRKEIEETFGIRACLESYATALATAHMDAPTIDRLESVLRLYRDALGRRDIANMTQLNNQPRRDHLHRVGERKALRPDSEFPRFYLQVQESAPHPHGLCGNLPLGARRDRQGHERRGRGEGREAREEAPAAGKGHPDQGYGIGEGDVTFFLARRFGDGGRKGQKQRFGRRPWRIKRA